MKSSTKTLIEAMQILASEIQSEDGVANAAILEASERLREQDNRIAELEAQLKAAKADGVREFGKWYVDTNDRSVFDVAINDLADLYADSLSKGKD
jgi:hypothetical protein